MLFRSIQKIINIFADTVWCIFSGIIAYISIKYVLEMFKFPYYSQTLRINLAYAYLIVPFGFTMMTIRTAVNTVKRFSKGTEIIEHTPNEQWKED